MNKQTLIIYDFNTIYKIFKEVEDYLNFNLVNIEKNKIDEHIFKNNDNFLIISNKKIKNLNNQLIIDQFPLPILKLTEIINIEFIKKKYNQQSEIQLGSYKLNLNSRKIFYQDKSLNLTEREANIVLFLKNSPKPVKIFQLQTQVWGHNSKLETHTVETHIYRLRKKIQNVFNDHDFIKSSKSGYSIQ